MAYKEQWLQDREADGLDDRIYDMVHVEVIDKEECSHRFQFETDLDATAMKKGDMVLLQDASSQHSQMVQFSADGWENPDSTGMLTVKFMDHRPASTFLGKRWNLRLDKTSGNLKLTVGSLWDCLTSPRHASLRACLIDGRLTPIKEHSFREVKLSPNKQKKLTPSSTKQLKELLQRALDASPFYLVQGPPCTGKTDLFIKNLVYNHQVEKPGEKLVVTAFTNRAVDEICEKLYELQGELPSLQFSRIGGAESASGRSKSYLLSEQLDQIEGLNREKVQRHIDKTHVWVSTVSSLSRNPDLMARLNPT